MNNARLWLEKNYAQLLFSITLITASVTAYAFTQFATKNEFVNLKSDLKYDIKENKMDSLKEMDEIKDLIRENNRLIIGLMTELRTNK